ncbi:BGTF surface domain-containing protein [Halorientalis brevis]|uniref:BGTF surface domain-containing protein n=1 Tax=Halorientalis brevis TaxID=1126241 RepID=A0ABD6CBE5_9EURY|nr:BGTF surface domain-containing protein [Halorientalis brevis]
MTLASAGATAAPVEGDDCYPEGGPFEGNASDIVEVTQTCEGYVIIGGDEMQRTSSNQNYLDILYVTGNFRINTRLLGTDAPKAQVYGGGVQWSYAYDNGLDSPSNRVNFDVDGVNTLADLRDKIGVTQLPRPVQPGRYQLVAGHNETVVLRDGAPSFENPRDRQNLRLSRPGKPGDLTTYIAPADRADKDSGQGEWTERNTVAWGKLNDDSYRIGDRVIVDGFDTTGIRGALWHLNDRQASDTSLFGDGSGTSPELFERLIDESEGVSITIEQTNPKANKEPKRITYDDVTADVAADENPEKAMFFQYDNGEFDLVINTGHESLRDDFAPGDKFRVEYTYESDDGRWFHFSDSGGMPGPFEIKSDDQYPYFDKGDTNHTVSTTFKLKRPKIQYDRVTNNGALLLKNDGTTTISGTTNLAPGTPIELQLVSQTASPPETVTIEDVEINDDGTFSTTADTAVFDEGANVEAELYVWERVVHTKDSVFVGNPEDPKRFQITKHNNVTVSVGDSLGDLRATVVNSGSLADTQALELSIAGTVESEQSIHLEPGQEDTIRFDGTTVQYPAGEYTYTLSSDDDSVTGTITVENATTPTTATPPDLTPIPTTPTVTQSTPPTATPTESSSTPTPERTPAPDDSGGVNGLGGNVLALGVTTREALGAGALVGGVYVLGALS